MIAAVTVMAGNIILKMPAALPILGDILEIGVYHVRGMTFNARAHLQPVKAPRFTEKFFFKNFPVSGRG